MNLNDLSTYVAGLCRSEPEVIAAFFMGALLAAMLAFSLRRWTFLSYGPDVESARKDAEIARKDAELARKGAEIAGFEARLASLGPRFVEGQEPVAIPRRRDADLEVPPPAERYAAMIARCEGLEAENRRMREERQAAEDDAASLRGRLAQALGEADHWAKWSRIFDEENARLTEMGLPSKG